MPSQEARLEVLESNLEHVEKKLDTLEDRDSKLELLLQGIQKELSTLNVQLAEMKLDRERLTKVEDRSERAEKLAWKVSVVVGALATGAGGLAHTIWTWLVGGGS